MALRAAALARAGLRDMRIRLHQPKLGLDHQRRHYGRRVKGAGQEPVPGCDGAEARTAPLLYPPGLAHRRPGERPRPPTSRMAVARRHHVWLRPGVITYDPGVAVPDVDHRLWSGAGPVA